MHDLIESVSDVAAFLRKPGKYHTSSGHQAYAVLQSLAWHPKVRLGEELFFPEGSVLFAEVLDAPVVRGPMVVPNVKKIGWGTTEDFYERRLRDYDNWETAFWREIVQNSRDAGATRLDLECVEGTYEDPESGEIAQCVQCVARDDGTGMNYDTLLGAFFRRGGSEKAAGSVGGFGDAKNLILTPWFGYEVRTQDVVARGRHEELFADLTQTGLEHVRGTQLTVWMPLTKATTPEHAQFLIEQSSLPNIRFSINGRQAHAALPQGKLILDKPIARRHDGAEVGRLFVYHSPEAERTGVYVRSHGIYMFEIQGYGGEGDFKGVVTIEVNAPPIDVFTTKRDQLSYDSSARADVYALLKELATDPAKALRAKRDKKEVVFRGTGAIEVREGRVAELAAEVASKVDLGRAAKRRKSGQLLTLDAESIKQLSEMVDRQLERVRKEDDPLGLAPLHSSFNLLVSENEFVDVEQVSIAIQMAMWKPDFFLYQNISPFPMPKALHPETMTRKYHELLRMWTEVCRFVLVQLGINKSFGVGWVFDTEYDWQKSREAVIGALYRKHDGVDWLLLNPVEIEVVGWREPYEFNLTGDRYSLGDPRTMERLVTYAVHEITHMQGFISHNDSYASALTANMQTVFRVAPVLKKIIREARAAVKEVRPAGKRRAKGPKIVWDPIDEDVVDGYLDDRRVIHVWRGNDRWYASVRGLGVAWLYLDDLIPVEREHLFVGWWKTVDSAKDLAARAVAAMLQVGAAKWERDLRNCDMERGEYLYGGLESGASDMSVHVEQHDGVVRYAPRFWAGSRWVRLPVEDTLLEAAERAEETFLVWRSLFGATP